MIGLRREAQKTLWEGVVNEDVKALWEAWMIAVDPLLSDEELVGQVYEAQGERAREEPDAGAMANSGREGASAVAAEACAQLEL